MDLPVETIRKLKSFIKEEWCCLFTDNENNQWDKDENSEKPNQNIKLVNSEKENNNEVIVNRNKGAISKTIM